MVWPESKISSLFGASRKSIYGFPRAPNPDSQKVGKDERKGDERKGDEREGGKGDNRA